jgi:hypothetical protein
VTQGKCRQKEIKINVDINRIIFRVKGFEEQVVGIHAVVFWDVITM